MTLPTGQISLSQVNQELGDPAAIQIALNDADVRALAQKTSGAISMADLQGKSAITTVDLSLVVGFVSPSFFGYVNPLDTAVQQGTLTPNVVNGQQNFRVLISSGTLQIKFDTSAAPYAQDFFKSFAVVAGPSTLPEIQSSTMAFNVGQSLWTTSVGGFTFQNLQTYTVRFKY